MPVPHEVTREFFIPTDDGSYFANDAQNAAQQIEQRINDLLFIFNLLDATRGMGAPEEENNPPNDNMEENDEDENAEEEEQNIPVENVAREVPHDADDVPDDADHNGEDGGNGNTRVIRLDEFDLLALPLLLMRSRIRTNPNAQRDRAQSEPDPGQDAPIDPLLMMLSRAFGPQP